MFLVVVIIGTCDEGNNKNFGINLRILGNINRNAMILVFST